MKLEGKDVIMISAIALAALLIGSIFGFFVGAWAGHSNGYDDGIDAGINYTNCVTEVTPLYGTVTDRILNDCWETYVYEPY